MCLCVRQSPCQGTCLSLGLALDLAFLRLWTSFWVPGCPWLQLASPTHFHLVALPPGSHAHPWDCSLLSAATSTLSLGPGTFPANLGANTGGGFPKLICSRTHPFQPKGRRLWEPYSIISQLERWHEGSFWLPELWEDALKLVIVRKW